MQITQEQIKEWKEKYGTFYELESEGKIAFIFDPTQKLVIVKALVEALNRGSLEYIDCLIANCWIAGDEEIKTNDQIKMGLVDKAKDIIDIPDYEVKYSNGDAIISVDGKEITVRLATRSDIKFAEDKNKKGKPLDTQIHLLERIAHDKNELNEWRNFPRLYMGLLLAIDEVKDKKYVALKKY